MKMKRLLALLLSAVMALALLTACGGNSGKKDKGEKKSGKASPEAAVEQFIEAAYTGNAKTVVNLLPDAVVEWSMEQSDCESRSEFIEQGKESMADTVERLENYFGRYTVEVEIRDTSEWTDSQIQSYTARLEREDIELEIEEGADVKVKITIDGTDDRESTLMTLSAIRVDGRWYVDLFSARSLM